MSESEFLSLQVVKRQSYFRVTWMAPGSTPRMPSGCGLSYFPQGSMLSLPGSVTRAKMTTDKNMGPIAKSLESSLATGNLQKMSETMDRFEKRFLNMEVQAIFMESSTMAGLTSLSTPEGKTNILMQQIADDYGLEVSVGLLQPVAHAVPTASTEKVDKDDLSRCLDELKARG